MRPKRIHHPPQGKEKTERRALTDQETENVLHTIQNHEHGLFLAVLYYLGLRRGEALATLFADSDGRLDDAEALLTDAFRLQPQKPPETTTIYKIIH